MDKDKLKQLARYCVNEGTDYTENGKWDISYEELYYHFGVEVSDTNQNGKLLAEELRKQDEINELIMTEDAIEITYHLEYCPQCQQGGLKGAMELVSLMGCNIYDEHEDESEEFENEEKVSCGFRQKM